MSTPIGISAASPVFPLGLFLFGVDRSIKKDEGINLNTLRNCEKAEIIGSLRKKHRLNELLQFLHISKSSYYYQANRLRSSDKYAALRREIHTLFHVADGRVNAEKKKPLWGYYTPAVIVVMAIAAFMQV